MIKGNGTHKKRPQNLLEMFLICQNLYLLIVSYLLKRVLRSKRGNFYWHLVLVTSEDSQSLILMIMQPLRPFGGYQEMKLTHSVINILILSILSVFLPPFGFCTRNPPAQLKQFSMFCFDLILRGKFKRSKIAFLVDGAEANVGQPNTIQNSDVEKEN